MDIAIIGNGITGITAARWIRKLSDHNISVISSESPHFFSRTALMYVYMGHLRWEDIKPYEDWFWEKNRIDLIYDHVQKIDFQNKKLEMRHSNPIEYDRLVIATGSKSNKFGWPGQDLEAVCGLYSRQDLEEMEKYSEGLQRAVVVGGGLIGIEMAEMFHSRGIPVTMVVREQSYWDNVLPPEEAAMISQHIRDHHIDLRLGVNLQEIIDDGNGRACGIIIKETGERIDCGFVGLTPGVSPNTGFLQDSGLEMERGILVDKYLRTNQPGVYAGGDCVQLRSPRDGRKAIEAVWYTGRMMGETIAHNICGNEVAYDPGIWFNSAKFIDIEYQVYGDVPRIIESPYSSLFWKHPDNTKSVRLVYDIKTGQILGFNLMGIRYRQEVCEKWLTDKVHVEEVIQNLSLANFDPEFYPGYEGKILAQYNRETGKNIQLKSKRSLDRVLAFLGK